MRNEINWTIFFEIEKSRLSFATCDLIVFQKSRLLNHFLNLWMCVKEKTEYCMHCNFENKLQNLFPIYLCKIIFDYKTPVENSHPFHQCTIIWVVHVKLYHGVNYSNTKKKGTRTEVIKMNCKLHPKHRPTQWKLISYADHVLAVTGLVCMDFTINIKYPVMRFFLLLPTSNNFWMNECYSFFIGFSIFVRSVLQFYNNSISTTYRFPILRNIPLDMLTLKSKGVTLFEKLLYNFEWAKKISLCHKCTKSIKSKSISYVWDRIEWIKMYNLIPDKAIWWTPGKSNRFILNEMMSFQTLHLQNGCDSIPRKNVFWCRTGVWRVDFLHLLFLRGKSSDPYWSSA